jgi:hypothetical protein
MMTATTGSDLYKIDLSGLPLGGSLLISSCQNPTLSATPGMTGWTGDNLLFAFRRCPADGLPLSWGCVASNDQGGSAPYVCSGLAQVTIAVNQTSYYVATSQWSTSAWQSGLWWSYTLPTPTLTSTASITASASATSSASATLSAGASVSGSLTATASATLPPSISSSATASPSPAPPTASAPASPSPAADSASAAASPTRQNRAIRIPV